MNKQEMIKKIIDELLCANECPSYHRTPYDIKMCSCYKMQIITILQSSILLTKEQAAEIMSVYNTHVKFFVKQNPFTRDAFGEIDRQLADMEKK